jgi:hypothetical protein
MEVESFESMTVVVQKVDAGFQTFAGFSKGQRIRYNATSVG